MKPESAVIPSSYRWALTLAVILGFQVALAAAFDVQTALHHDEPASMEGSEASVPGSNLSPQAQRAVWLASASAYQGALSAMLPWRIGASVLLALGAGLVFFAAMRLRMAPAQRSALAFQLGGAALIAAVMRTIDGGLNLVLAETTAREVGRALIHEGLTDAEILAPMLQWAFSIASGGWTLLIVALFVGLGRYFRSRSLQEGLEQLEKT